VRERSLWTSESRIGTPMRRIEGATAQQQVGAAPQGGNALVVLESAVQFSDTARQLGSAGWNPIVTCDAERAQWLASIRNFGLIVVCGHSLRWLSHVLTELRPVTKAPVLVLSPELEQRQATMLRLGADMVLPSTSRSELVQSAAQALVRHARINEPTLRFLEAEDLTIDLWARRTFVEGREVDLTPTEFDILRLLMTRPQIAVKHDEILKSVWNWKYTHERNALRLQINRLRNKLADDCGQVRFIKLVRGLGYLFDRPVVEFGDDRGSARTGTAQESTTLVLARMLRSLNKSLIGVCDGAAVFTRGVGVDQLRLVVQQGMPPEWEHAVAAGIPLTESFLAADTVNSRQIRSYVETSQAAMRYRRSSRLMRAAECRFHLSLPLIDHNSAWGQVGFARRSGNAFTSQESIVLESAAAVLGTVFNGVDEPAVAVC
jgi:DNA-binding response OmpR family regulator